MSMCVGREGPQGTCSLRPSSHWLGCPEAPNPAALLLQDGPPQSKAVEETKSQKPQEQSLESMPCLL